MRWVLSTTSTKVLRAHLSNKELPHRLAMCHEKERGVWKSGRKFVDESEKRKKKGKQMKTGKARKSKCSLEGKTQAEVQGTGTDVDYGEMP